MNTDKKQCRILASSLFSLGVEHAVISPGSRNAPLIMAFNRQQGMNCLSIADERSAAFFALGMAQQTRKPVVLICTSGTAVLNYSPAIAEAYYQHIPLIVITADRPPEWIDQQDGQAIRQRDIYHNYIKKSFSLPVEILTTEDSIHCEEIVAEAFRACIYPGFGPVHINVPLREPLYKQTQEEFTPSGIKPELFALPQLSTVEIQEIVSLWNNSSKKMIITGLLHPDDHLNSLINQIAERSDVVVLTETTSNLHGDNLHPCIDRIITAIDKPQEYKPDLLLSIGGPLISRKIKVFLREHKPLIHWNVSPEEPDVNAYLSLTRGFMLQPDYFLELLVKNTYEKQSGFAELYQHLETSCAVKHTDFLSNTPFSDLKAFEILFGNIPENSIVQLGNSTPVRYAQLFHSPEKTFHFSNRGTSGIDGCCSTAAGAAYVSCQPNILITGDIGFFYDSNFLWNNYLRKNLRIIIINNEGGGIFRFIDVPDSLNELDPYIETPHQLDASKMAETYGIPYFTCADESGLKSVLTKFLQPSQSPVILEIKTPRMQNGRILRNYFENLKV